MSETAKKPVLETMHLGISFGGLLRSASGSITLDGTDLQSVPANSIIRMGLAHVRRAAMCSPR